MSFFHESLGAFSETGSLRAVEVMITSEKSNEYQGIKNITTIHQYKILCIDSD